MSRGIFEEFCKRVHTIGEGCNTSYVCAMKMEHVTPLLQRVKSSYVIISIDRVDDINHPLGDVDVECIVHFAPAEPDEDSSNEDSWIEDYGDDLYYK